MCAWAMRRRWPRRCGGWQRGIAQLQARANGCEGEGWDEGKLADRRYPTAAELDLGLPANPVWLTHTTGHYGVANSAALRLANITAQTNDPPAGTIDRDAQGRPTGVFKEAAMNAVSNLIPPPTPSSGARASSSSIDSCIAKA